MIPLALYTIYNYKFQPYDNLKQCYEYLIAKRTAKCRYEKYLSDLREKNFTEVSENLKTLSSFLNKNKLTLYEYEHSLLENILEPNRKKSKEKSSIFHREKKEKH